MNAIHEAINNLQSSSLAIDNFVNDPKNYNTPFANYLEVISWEMHKQANELREMENIYGGW